jgi:hypothetical protein
MTVKITKAYLPHEFKLEDYKNAKAVFVNVGPRNCLEATKLVEGIECPVILCENDPSCVQDVLKNTSIKKCYFAVPDVITSNSAPEHILGEDSLSVISENGELFIDERASEIKIKAKFLDEKELLGIQWTPKLYLHNTPHCVAAYLGALAGCTYLHETMQFPVLRKIVSGCMNEMLQALKVKWEIPHEFLDWYAEKEMKRFECQLLFDPIARVAREPIRKLELDGRLVGASQIALSHGFVPENILIGIAGALLFNNADDPDKHLNFLRENLTNKNFLTYILGLRDSEALTMILSERLDMIIAKLLLDIETVRG